jgi:predicted RNase H-like nuclease (RuvC/YqgF family)
MPKRKVDTTIPDAKESIRSTRVSDALRIADLTTDNERLVEENKELKRALKAQNQIIESELKADSINRIKAMSTFKDSELENLRIEELQQIEKSLSKSKTVDTKYKSIRAGTASQGESRFTVGNLYGKSRKQILEMEGDF